MNSSIAFLFPGQGSQQVGMGKDFFDAFPIARDTFQEAEEALEKNLAKLCFEGPDDQLRLTQNTQPAILTVSIIASRLLRKNGIIPSFSAGHSLGEYSALVDTGALSFSDAVKIVRKRGQFMQEAVPAGKGAMAAIIGLSKNQVNEICQQSHKKGVVVPANYNTALQIVLAGETEAVREAIKNAEQTGAKRAIMLPVSAPFHCELMKPAETNLAKELEQIEVKNFTNPIVTNVDAQLVKNHDQVKTSLARQVSSPVLWEDSMKVLLAQGVETFIEVGQGRVLSGLMRNIERSVKVLHVSDRKSLEKTLAQLK